MIHTTEFVFKIRTEITRSDSRYSYSISAIYISFRSLYHSEFLKLKARFVENDSVDIAPEENLIKKVCVSR